MNEQITLVKVYNVNELLLNDADVDTSFRYTDKSFQSHATYFQMNNSAWSSYTIMTVKLLLGNKTIIFINGWYFWKHSSVIYGTAM